MFLKTLVIRGFKSFADRATLDFEPGVTVVVGPNGSGKSNVVDAIAWVLGAQAPTAVRSQRMDDVIFAGTSSRPALGRAEVSLTIDNSSGYLPLDFNEVTVRRTLFRSGDSEYAINGVPCRLLDVQELLSDAGVGRQQHVIASQGQLDAILNARPEERRAIIEEAAGVLKHRKRRERSERRLVAAEADLTRVVDLQREVRRQLRPLERQARAARQAEELAGEARRLRRHLAGREIAALRERVEAQQAEREALANRAAAVEDQWGELGARVAAAEAELVASSAQPLAEAVARAATVRERARGLAAVLTERRRATQREAAQVDDGSALALLAAELEGVEQEDREQLAEADRLTAERVGHDEADAALEAERRALPGPERPSSGTAPPGAGPGTRLVELRRELAGVRAALDQREAEVHRLRSRHRQLNARVERLRSEAMALSRAAEGAEDAEEGLDRAAQRAETQLREAEARLGAAEEARREAEAAHRGWQARADALGQALDEVRARAGAARLAGRAGVLGTLLDVVEVDAGWEAAVEAAAGDALTAVVVEDVDAARSALEALHREGATGAVLPARATVPGGQPALRADAVAVDGPLAGQPVDGPLAGQPVAGHVRARRDLPERLRDAVDRLLEVVVGPALRVEGGWSDAARAAGDDAAAAVLVTAAGDRFATTGWRLGAARVGATGELHREAGRRAEAAAAERQALTAEHEAAREALEEARRAHSRAVRACDEHATRQREASSARQRTSRELGEAAGELSQLDRQLTQLDGEVDAGRRHHRALADRLPELEAAARADAENTRRRSEAVAELDRRRTELSRRRLQVDVRLASVAERRTALARRRQGLVRARDAALQAERDREARRVVLAERSAVLERLADIVAQRLARVEEHLVVARARHGEQAERARAGEAALADLRRRRSAIEAEREQLGERARQVELALTESVVRLEAARTAAERDLAASVASHDPGPAEDRDQVGDGPGPGASAPREHADGADPRSDRGADAPLDLPEGVDPMERLAEVENELRLLGPVNPLAAQEHAALVERNDFLEAQVADVRASRRELARVVRAIDDEIAATFAAAFADVGAHFQQLFATLFPGGNGELRLTDPDDLGATGVDVDARPSGKNVRKLSLLSGGERSLTALGLLFAVFRSRPSPFYVLDEVEASLDDVNLRRFLELLEGFRSEAQLIVVSHQKRTMEVADCLYGVTMKPGGSSVVVSERVDAPPIRASG